MTTSHRSRAGSLAWQDARPQGWPRGAAPGDGGGGEDVLNQSCRPAVRRVLIASADIGEGHDAAGRALAEAARERWPGVDVVRLDTLQALGPGVGPLLRYLYTASVERAPFLYDFFYTALERHRWFAEASKWGMGAWAGRRMAPRVEVCGPDVVLSTYPLASAGLAWARRHGRLPQPVAAWVTDAPHPFWLYPEVDVTYLLDDVALLPARSAVPDARLEVSEPAVARSFRDDDPEARCRVRQHLGACERDRVVLVACGALGFGEVEQVAAALVDTDPTWHVVVVCGRNHVVERRAGDRFSGQPRVHVLGWSPDMPALVAACDLVVSPAGGVSVLEAAAQGRPVVMFRPIAGHGRANARLLAEAGLAETCHTTAQLVSCAGRLMDRPSGHLPTGVARRPGLALGSALDQVAERCPTPAGRRLAPADALFLDVETPTVPQQIGAVILVDPGAAGPLPAEFVTSFAAAIPGIAGRLQPGRWLRSPRWVPLPAQAGQLPVSSARLASSGEGDGDGEGDGGKGGDGEGGEGLAGLGTVVDEFFSERLDLSGPAARLRLVDGLPGGQQALLVQVHHALCDGVILTRSLVRRARELSLPVGESPPVPSGSEGTAAAGRAGSVARRQRAAHAGTARRRASVVRSMAAGTWSLARAGRAPRTPLDGPVTDLSLRHLLLDVSARRVRAAALRHGCSTAELLLAVLGEALGVAVPGLADATGQVRVMVPRTFRPRAERRGAGSDPCAAGNQTGAFQVDLPVRPLPAGRRVDLVRTAMRRREAAAQPAAARGVVRVVGALPPPARRWVNRRAYCSRWFSGVATVLPWPDGEVELRGRRVDRVYPIVPLAPGVNLGFGAISRRQGIGASLTLGPSLILQASALSAAFAEALRHVTGSGARDGDWSGPDSVPK